MEAVIALLITGAILILLETVLPGAVAGVIGFCCLAAGVVMAYVNLGPTAGHWTLLGVGLGSCLGAFLWAKYFPDSRAARLFVSEQQVGDLGVGDASLVHQTGVAHSALRPCGTAIISGKRLDVVTEGGFIEPGTSVKVVAVEGLRVVVRQT
jgi:membrane-bound serine protease (ClpP class)